jgi:hypothetical protein
MVGWIDRLFAVLSRESPKSTEFYAPSSMESKPLKQQST